MTIDLGDGNLDRGKLLPEDAQDDARYWQVGDTLVALTDLWVGGGDPWLVAYRAK